MLESPDDIDETLMLLNLLWQEWPHQTLGRLLTLILNNERELEHAKSDVFIKGIKRLSKKYELDIGTL